MTKRNATRRALPTALLIFSMLTVGLLPANGQDLMQVSDISGGSSVFVFRKNKSRFVASQRTTRTRTQRTDSARNIARQYDSQNHRQRTTYVSPDKVPNNTATLPKDQASKVFAGVGEYYLNTKDVTNALQFFREAVSLDDKNTRAKEGLSDALVAKAIGELVDGKTPQSSALAKIDYDEALKYNPKNAAAYTGLGTIYSDMDKSDEAIANFEKALSYDPTLTSVYQPLGILYFQKGEIAKADDLLTKAVATASETAETQLFLGMVRYSQNRNEDALAAFKRAKTLDPTNADAFFHSGETLVRMGKTSDAVADFSQAVSLRANYFDAYRGLGAAYSELGNYNDAIAAYKQAAKIKNDSAAVYIALGDANRLAHNFNDAESNYNLAVIFMPRSTDYTQDDVADVYSKIGFVIGQQCAINMKQAIPCKWPSAIKALEKALQAGGNNTADYANLGWAYYSAANVDFIQKNDAEGKLKLEQARINLQKAVDANPAYVAGPMVNLGMTLTDLGDYAGAVSNLSKAVAIHPEWTFAQNELGIAYRKLNNFGDAIKAFQKAIDNDDSFASAHYNLGEAEFRNGNIGNAKREYKKLMTMGRKDLATQLMIISNGAVAK